MKVIIIEDEPLAAKRLARLVESNYKDYQILAILDTVRESIDFLKERESEIDLLFCDIHLADGTSFEIFDKITVTMPIIFTTAYDEYTLKAFDVNSIHYLLKPIDEEDLAKAIRKFENRQENTNNNVSVDQLLKTLSPSKPKRFLLKHGNHIVPKKENDLALFYIQNKVVHTRDMIEGKTYLTDYTLEELEKDMLATETFFRINRKQIVNKDAIKSFQPFKNQRLSLLLSITTPEELVLSRDKVNQFKEWFVS